MKKLILSLVMALCLVIGVSSFAPKAEAANYIFNMHGQWTVGAEPDLAGWYLWSSIAGAGNKRNYDVSLTPNPWVVALNTLGATPLLPKTTPQPLSFTSVVIDSVGNPVGTYQFWMQSIDINGNVSAFSTSFDVPYSIDLTAPAVPTGLNFSILNQVKQ